MRFPDPLSIKVTSGGKPVPGILVRVTIFMQRKNNYYLIWPTDLMGKCSISRADMLMDCQVQLTYGIMDYLSPEADNTGRIGVAVLTPEQTSDEQRVLAHHHGKAPQFQERYAAYLERSKEIVERIGLNQISIDASCAGGEMILVS